MTTPQELLTKAADLIEERGLNQNGGYYNADTECFCALGALAWAEGKRNWVGSPSIPSTLHWTSAFAEAVERLTRAAGLTMTYDIPKWNDRQATPQQVVEAMRRAAVGGV